MSDWKPIAPAPVNADLELSIYDQGEYHAVVFPCRRDGSSWRDVRRQRLLRAVKRHEDDWFAHELLSASRRSAPSGSVSSCHRPHGIAHRRQCSPYTSSITFCK